MRLPCDATGGSTSRTRGQVSAAVTAHPWAPVRATHTTRHTTHDTRHTRPRRNTTQQQHDTHTCSSHCGLKISSSSGGRGLRSASARSCLNVSAVGNSTAAMRSPTHAPTASPGGHSVWCVVRTGGWRVCVCVCVCVKGGGVTVLAEQAQVTWGTCSPWSQMATSSGPWSPSSRFSCLSMPAALHESGPRHVGALCCGVALQHCWQHVADCCCACVHAGVMARRGACATPHFRRAALLP
jgi:hypothetical protein